MKRTVGLVLCFLLLLSSLTAFAGCKKNTGSSEDTTKNHVTTAEGDTYVPPDVNYGGKDFNIFTWDNSKDWVLELNDKLPAVDTETYYHLKAVEEELSIKFNIAREEKGNYDNRSAFINKVYMLSGDDGIDLICQYSLAAAVGTQQGLYQDLTQVNYITWDAPYWSDGFRTANTVNGKMYYCTGDLTGSVIKNMFLMTFNYTMAQDYNLGDLYALVEDGKWTFEQLGNFAKLVYSDDNNSQAKDVGDTFGLVIDNYLEIDAFQAAANLPSLIINSLGELEINSQLSGDYGVNVCDELKKLFHENEGAYCHTKENPGYSQAMSTGKALFQPYVAENVMSELAGSDIDYGILPLPKYNEDQENYSTCIAMTYNMFSIPVVARDADMSGAVLESMAHNGYISLNPVLFQALQYRYSQHPSDVQMLEILRNGIMYDPGRILDTVDIFALVRRTVRDSEQITTYYAADRNKFRAGLEEVNFMFS